MPTKMATLKCGMALLSTAVVTVAGCRIGPRYYPAGGPGKLDVSGVYATKVEIYSTTCRGLSVVNGRTYVEHTPGALTFRLTHNDEPFDGRIQPNGSFNTNPVSISRGRVMYTTNINGRFRDSTFYARVNVKIFVQPNLRTVTPTVAPPEACEYQLRWSGTRL